MTKKPFDCGAFKKPLARRLQEGKRLPGKIGAPTPLMKDFPEEAPVGELLSPMEPCEVLNRNNGPLLLGSRDAKDWVSDSFVKKTETIIPGVSSQHMAGRARLLREPDALHEQTASSMVGDGAGGEAFTHYIGEEFGGGVIFHLWNDAAGVEHGYIVDKVFLSTSNSRAWSNITDEEIGPSAQNKLAGLSNSKAIVAQDGHVHSAAALCLNSTNGGQRDWYLPSINELWLLWPNRFLVNETIAKIGGAAVPLIPSYLWSSTEDDNICAYYFSFYLGYASISHKLYPYYVRAVRAF